MVNIMSINDNFYFMKGLLIELKRANATVYEIRDKLCSVGNYNFKFQGELKGYLIAKGSVVIVISANAGNPLLNVFQKLKFRNLESNINSLAEFLSWKNIDCRGIMGQESNINHLTGELIDYYEVSIDGDTTDVNCPLTLVLSCKEGTIRLGSTYSINQLDSVLMPSTAGRYAIMTIDNIANKVKRVTTKDNLIYELVYENSLVGYRFSMSNELCDIALDELNALGVSRIDSSMVEGSIKLVDFKGTLATVGEKSIGRLIETKYNNENWQYRLRILHLK